MPTEQENDKTPQQEHPQESINEPETKPMGAPAAPEVQPEPKPAPEPEAVTNLQPSGKIYVEGFGWLEYQGPNHCEYGADF